MNYSRVNSPIVKLHWAGWGSDTLALQRAGWQISCEEDIYRHAIRIALKHPEYKMYGLSNHIEHRFDPRYQHDFVLRDFCVPVQYMMCQLHVNMMGNLSDFRPIDAEPSFITNEIRSIEDFKIFKPIREAEQQIVVPQQSVPELLEQILKMQDPKQYEIREKRRKEIRQFMRQAINIDAGNIDERVAVEVVVAS